MKFDHAVHNEQLCDHLITLKSYNDWVVTTSFYSALHYVTNKIFPLEIENINYNDIEQFVAVINERMAPTNHKSKHSITIDLVRQHLKSISSKYKWLFDNCKTARYHKYQIDEDIALKSRDHLNDIKEFCIKDEEL